MRKRILLFICAVSLLLLLAVPAGAETVDTAKRGSISVYMKYDGEEVSGGELTIYRVAQIRGTAYEYLPEYASCEVPLNDLSDSKLPPALAELVKTNELSGTVGEIDAHGKIKFEELETGLYLVVQTKAAEGFNAVNPFVVSVPAMQGGKYTYDVDASPKMGQLTQETTAPTTPPPTTTPGTHIPQTGQNHWPIPALTAGGLFLIGLGWCLRASDKKKHYEN